MSLQDLIKKHLEEKCKNCERKDCTGITVLQFSNRTKCINYEGE